MWCCSHRWLPVVWKRVVRPIQPMNVLLAIVLGSSKLKHKRKHKKRYSQQYMHSFVVLCVVYIIILLSHAIYWHPRDWPIFYMVASLAPGQLYNCTCVKEVSLKCLKYRLFSSKFHVSLKSGFARNMQKLDVWWMNACKAFLMSLSNCICSGHER